MCRLLAYIGPETSISDVVVNPARSIIKQSYDARERMHDHSLPLHLQYGNINADGFGVGFYSCSSDDPVPCTFKATTPAWNNDNLNRISRKLTSKLIFAHVRAAMPGMPVAESSCHPFIFGNYLFMHNGCVAGFDKVRRGLINELSDEVYAGMPTFSVDSAVCFGVFLTHLPDLHARQPASAMFDALNETISTIRRHQQAAGIDSNSLLNFVVSDGETLIASRYVCGPPDANAATMYFAEGAAYKRASINHLSHVSAPKQKWSAAASVIKANRMFNSMGTNKSTSLETFNGCYAPAPAQNGVLDAHANEDDYQLGYSAKGSTTCLIASEPVTSSAADWVELPKKQPLLCSVQRMAC